MAETGVVHTTPSFRGSSCAGVEEYLGIADLTHAGLFFRTVTAVTLETSWGEGVEEGGRVGEWRRDRVRE